MALEHLAKLRSRYPVQLVSLSGFEFAIQCELVSPVVIAQTASASRWRTLSMSDARRR